MDVVPVARDFFSCHLVDKPEEAEDGTNLYRPDIRVCLDRIWAGWFSDNPVAIFYWSLPVLFIILLIMGMGTALTGLIVNMKVVTIGGTLGALSSLGCLFIHGFDQILLFALAFFFMMVIPGHFLNYKAKKGGGI